MAGDSRLATSHLGLPDTLSEFSKDLKHTCNRDELISEADTATRSLAPKGAQRSGSAASAHSQRRASAAIHLSIYITKKKKS